MSSVRKEVNNVVAKESEIEEQNTEDHSNFALANVDDKFIVPQHLSNNVITRHFIMQWDNSLAGLSAVPENATWRPLDGHYDIFQSTTRYAPNCRKAATRQGNLSQAILVGMKIKKVESNFPCQLGLKIHGAKGNFYTCNGERYAYLIGSNESNPNLDEVVVTTNPYVNSEYLRMYPGMTKDKLRSEGIMHVPGENYVFVDKKHPIVEMMGENQDVLQIDLANAELIDNRWYKVSKVVTERCLGELESELVENLPILDLSEFNASVHRLYGRDWDAEEEVCDNISQRDLRSRVMTTNRRATAVVQITYAFL
jgi:hypothetical protein